MKKSLLSSIIFSCFLLFSTTLSAQGIFTFVDKSPAKRAQKVTRVMTERLNLDEVQAEKMHVVNLKYAELMQPILASKLSFLDIWTKVQVLNDQRLPETKAILHKEQIAQLDSKRQQLKGLLENMLARL